MTNVLDKFVQDIKANVPGFIAVSVTEVKSGVSYVAVSADPTFDPNLASAYNLEVVKAKMNALRILGLEGKEKIDGNYFVYLVVDSSKANLGITRSLLARYKKDLQSIF